MRNMTMLAGFLKCGAGLFLAHALIVMVLFTLVPLAIAQPGNLDDTFGGGLVTRDGGLGMAVTTQPDGKILVTGRADNGDYDLMVARYHPSGMRDASFGLQGIIIWDGGFDDRGEGIVVQPDGKIVVVGTTGNGADDDMMVARFNADGSLDSGFGINGIVILNGFSLDEGHAVSLQPDFRIVEEGRSFIIGSNDFIHVRIKSDGTPDSGFNAVGVMKWDNGGNQESASGLALQPDGRIVVVGYSFSGGNDDLAVVRVNANGTLDSGFGNNGVLLWDGFGEARGADVALQGDGRIVVVGERDFIGTVDVLVLRLNGDGTLDNTWDGGAEDQGTDVLVENDGRIVVSGFTNNGSDNDLLLLRFDSSGNLDGEFASGGAFIWDGGYSDLFHSLSSQPDGMILGIGGTYGGAQWDVVLMRLYGGTGIIPDITVNGGDGPLFLQPTDSLTVSWSLQNSGITDNSDWWLAVDTSFGIWFWTFFGWTDSPLPFYSGPLYTLDMFSSPAIPLLGLPAGTYTFYFGVDMNMDGNISIPSLYLDSAVVNIAP